MIIIVIPQSQISLQSHREMQSKKQIEEGLLVSSTPSKLLNIYDRHGE